MYAQILFLVLFSAVSFADEMLLTAVKTSAEAVKNCSLKLGGRGYYLNMCPAGTVMVGAQTLNGSPTLQVLCAKFEVVCE